MSRAVSIISLSVVLAGLLPGGSLSPVMAQAVDAVTGRLERAGIAERLGETVDLEATLVNEKGERVRMAELLGNGRPVILNFVYHTCPMLCSMVLEATTKAASEVEWTPGVEYDIISVSISETDTPETAGRQKEIYVDKLGRDGAEAGWHFLTGEPDQVARVAASVGFGYQYEEQTGEYGHGAALILLSPEGVVTRYLYGISYTPFDLRAGLVEASEGTVGNIVDRLIMFCYAYDPAEGSYVPQAWLMMRLAGGFTVLALAFGLGLLWVRDRKNDTVIASEV